MKIALFMILCSGVAGNCLEPIKINDNYNTFYDCMVSGYEESITKMQEVGPESINEYKMFIKFYCTTEKNKIST